MSDFIVTRGAMGLTDHRPGPIDSSLNHSATINAAGSNNKRTRHVCPIS
ncbi:hypothetical protein SAMN05216255_0369 [Pseudomonas segetis]|uniref:Uncharacterized protein n=1 Tax=Pseudomonas segetis TaxID=298908 RepID=A0A238ZEP3_9PSED|nr:hypothetical protein SAMN05216255_0369 [Pseudomonas segetis]